MNTNVTIGSIWQGHIVTNVIGTEYEYWNGYKDAANADNSRMLDKVFVTHFHQTVEIRACDNNGKPVKGSRKRIQHILVREEKVVVEKAYRKAW